MGVKTVDLFTEPLNMKIKVDCLMFTITKSKRVGRFYSN